MSEITAEHNTSNDDFELEMHVELECIKKSHERLLPIIEKVAEAGLNNISSNALDDYIELEKLSLELSRLALDCLAIQKGIVPPQRQPKLATQEQLAEIKEMLLKLKRT